ncbi:peptidase domain-containing ABC transporter [Mucilaginibacter sp. KACC 22063]|uniref:peptidase domain-containing ABC transporter n=1 Tax=Mucilaginibacter sp. KACC 22063 TaxID=3025666 RepID=UPI0023668C7B|nr:peptidase domain-containing ABC transporter [Mucilaginibacter sp. KACC 22063]WDF54875.1 peptidase domain-containing ABC transporter [Mucilaginibacter sp. KACC 22063]
MRKGTRVKQRDISDCGAACLASVAAYYQLQLPISRIRQFAGTDQKGTNVLGMIEAAERLGFQAKGAKGVRDSLEKIPLPAIAHLNLKSGLNHYVVIYKVDTKNIVYMDPGDAQIYKKSIHDFCLEWTGVIILLLPSESFKAGAESNSNMSRFITLLKPHRSLILQAFIGALLYTVLGLSTAIYVQKIVDFALVENNVRLLNLLSIGMIVIIVFQFIINYVKSIIGLRTGQIIDSQLILGYYKHLLKLPQRFYDTMRVGEIISRVNDAVKIRFFINDVALGMVVNVLIVGFSVSIMFFYYWKLALIMLSIVPVYVALYLISNYINKKLQRKLMENSADLETQLVESINATATIKHFGLEEHAVLKTESRFIDLLRSIYDSNVKGLRISNFSDFSTKFMTIIILWIGGYFVIQRELSPGELLSFYALIGYFTGPAISLIGANKSIQDALIATDRLFEIIDLETESSTDLLTVMTPKLIGDIQFIDVLFKYGTRTLVFNGLNLKIIKNQTTAIIGESGSGKSTLLSLMQNIHPVSGGKIMIGGIDIRFVNNNSLRKVISVVPQKIDLFAGTIIENIAIGEYEPDLQRILMLSKYLGIDEFIEKMPNGFNSFVTEQGTNFSGGQKQRIAIARALYRNPEILILDEATSSLDPVSEQKVQATLTWFKQLGKTIIIIAHRLSTIKNCDEILVLSDGKLVEQGTHESLLKLEGAYTKLWRYHSV